MDWFFGSNSWVSLVGSALALGVGFVAKKYVIPFLQVGKRRQYAKYITVIANDVIDEMRSKYPEKDWLKHLDEAVDRLTAICGIKPEIARRAVRAVAARK